MPSIKSKEIVEEVSSNNIEIQQQEVVSENTVSLANVEKPKYQDIVFVLNDILDVRYGDGENYLHLNSGLPGFGCPMFVVTQSFSDEDSIRVVTDYGEYHYTLVESLLVMGVDESLQKIDFGSTEELMFILSKEDNRLFSYKLEGGTKIVL